MKSKNEITYKVSYLFTFIILLLFHRPTSCIFRQVCNQDVSSLGLKTKPNCIYQSNIKCSFTGFLQEFRITWASWPRPAGGLNPCRVAFKAHSAHPASCKNHVSDHHQTRYVHLHPNPDLVPSPYTPPHHHHSLSHKFSRAQNWARECDVQDHLPLCHDDVRQRDRPELHAAARGVGGGCWDGDGARALWHHHSHWAGCCRGEQTRW